MSDTYQRNTPNPDDRGAQHVDQERAVDEPVDRDTRDADTRDTDARDTEAATAAYPPARAREATDDPRAEPVSARDGEPVRARDDVPVTTREPVTRRDVPVTTREPVAARDDVVARDEVVTREEVVGREREAFGGIKWGSAFFGWLAAMGMAVLLVAILSAIGAGVGLSANGGDTNAAAKAANDNATTVGLIGAIALAVILFFSYYCGGYVAGRMARFAGARQGFAVWIWAIIFAIIGAIIAGIAGSQYDVLSKLNSFPRIPVNEGTLTTGGIITAIVVALLSLGGAVLGGLAGMRYHRVVDRVGFTPAAEE